MKGLKLGLVSGAILVGLGTLYNLFNGYNEILLILKSSIESFLITVGLVLILAQFVETDSWKFYIPIFLIAGLIQLPLMMWFGGPYFSIHTTTQIVVTMVIKGLFTVASVFFASIFVGD